MTSPWSTALPDWERRLLAGKSLVPSGLPLNEAEASKAVRVFNRLRVPDVIGQPRFETAAGGWFRDIVRVLFGALDEAGSRRWVQEGFLLVPKKNAKSTQAAGLMLTAMIMNRRPNDEAMFLAPTKEIADICFGQAEKMIKADPALDKLFHRQRHIRTITHRVTDSILKVKAADTDAVTGFKGSKALIDETHVFASHPRAADVFLEVRGALAAKPDGFLAQITTQSKTAPAGVFKAEREQARAVRDGTLDLPMLAVLYELPRRMQEPPKDGSRPAWTDPAVWPRLNPNFGVSVDPAFLERELRKAEQKGNSALALFGSQHFNIEIGVALSTDGWAGQSVWTRGIEPGLTLDELIVRSEVICIGIDGGGLDDLLGISVIGRERGTKRWLHWAHALIGPEALERRKANEIVLPGLREGRRHDDRQEAARRPRLREGDGGALSRVRAAGASRRRPCRRRLDRRRVGRDRDHRGGEVAGRHPAGHPADERGEDDRAQAVGSHVPARRFGADGVVRREREGARDTDGGAGRARGLRLREDRPADGDFQRGAPDGPQSRAERRHRDRRQHRDGGLR